FGECARAHAMVGTPEFQARLRALRAAAFADYGGVAGLKFQVLELLHESFRERHLARNTARAQAFRAFQNQGGEPLQLHALFETLQEHFSRKDEAPRDWLGWPGSYRDPRSADVARFACEHGERVEYFLYLQWLAELQLAGVAQRLRELNVPL